MDELLIQKDAVHSRLAQVLCLIHDAKKTFIKQLISQQMFNEQGWKELYQGLAGALEPLFMHPAEADGTVPKKNWWTSCGMYVTES